MYSWQVVLMWSTQHANVTCPGLQPTTYLSRQAVSQPQIYHQTSIFQHLCRRTSRHPIVQASGLPTFYYRAIVHSPIGAKFLFLNTSQDLPLILVGQHIGVTMCILFPALDCYRVHAGTCTFPEANSPEVHHSCYHLQQSNMGSLRAPRPAV